MDDFEKSREGFRHSTEEELYLPYYTRNNILKAWDVSIDEIARAQKECDRIRKQRLETQKKLMKKLRRQMRRRELIQKLKKRIHVGVVPSAVILALVALA